MRSKSKSKKKKLFHKIVTIERMDTILSSIVKSKTNL